MNSKSLILIVALHTHAVDATNNFDYWKYNYNKQYKTNDYYMMNYNNKYSNYMIPETDEYNDDETEDTPTQHIVCLQKYLNYKVKNLVYRPKIAIYNAQTVTCEINKILYKLKHNKYQCNFIKALGSSLYRKPKISKYPIQKQKYKLNNLCLGKYILKDTIKNNNPLYKQNNTLPTLNYKNNFVYKRKRIVYSPKHTISTTDNTVNKSNILRLIKVIF